MLINEEVIRKQNELDFDIKETRQHVVNAPLRSLESPERIAINLQYRQDHGMPGTFSALERSLDGDDTLGSDFFEKGLKAMRSVGRIRVNLSGNRKAYGTGFLVAPNILLTNNHVIADKGLVSQCEVDFGYEIDAYGREKTPFIFQLDPKIFLTSKELDFTFVGVSSTTVRGDNLLNQFGYLPLNPQPAKVLLKQCMSIIQHPNGLRKRLAIRENRLIKITDHHLWYYTDTERGSSGSPVFNDAWEVVGLHHSGVVRQDENGNYLKLDGTIWDGKTPIDDSLLDWIANEAIRTSTIYNLLQSEFKSSSGVTEVIEAHQKPLPVNQWENSKQKSSKTNHMEQPYQVNIPVTIVIGNGSSANSPLPTVTVTADTKETPNQAGINSTKQDAGSDNSANALGVSASEGTGFLVESYRGGYTDLIPYDVTHLGMGLKVALPKPSATTLISEVLSYRDEQSNTSKEWLDYIHFSVLINKRWKFAMATAVNIDGSQEQRNVDRRKWFIDTRIGKEYQFEPKIKEYYGTSTMNRGHMVRREDPIWGPRDLAVKASDYTFHLTNSVPQAASLNQKRWLALEDFIKEQAWNENEKVSVFTGPILLDNEENKSKNWFGSYKQTTIPMAFWKVVAYPNQDQELRCAAFLMNQVADVSRLELDYANPTNAEIKISQLTLSELTRISGIQFDEKLYEVDAYAKHIGNAGITETNSEVIITRNRDIVL